MVELDRAQERRFAHISKAALSWTHHCERSGSPMTYSTNPRRCALATTTPGWCAERNRKP